MKPKKVKRIGNKYKKIKLGKRKQAKVLLKGGTAIFVKVNSIIKVWGK